MEGKLLKPNLVYLLMFTVMFGIFNTLIVYGAYEDQNYIIVERDYSKDKVALYEEQDITYKITGDEFSLGDGIYDLIPKEINLVIDLSGSMAFDVNGNSIPWYKNTKSRLDILKAAANNFIDNFVNKNVKIAFTTYAYEAAAPTSLYDMKNSTAVNDLKNEINSLEAYGSTNMGDAVRRAYYSLAGSSNPDAMKYMVMMTDGEPNMFSSNLKLNLNQYNISSTADYSNEMLLEDGEAHYTYGQNNSQGLKYVEKTAGLLKDNGEISSYVVGFSSGSSDEQLEKVGIAADSKINPDTGEHFYKALTESDMLNIYNTIAQDIYNELGFKSAKFYEILPYGVEPVNLPEGFTSEVNADGRYCIKGDISDLKLEKQEIGNNYKVVPKEIDIRVKFNTVGSKQFGVDEGKIDYVDPFYNSKTALFTGDFNVIVGNKINDIAIVNDLYVEKGQTEKLRVTLIREDQDDVINTDFDVTAEIVLADGNIDTNDLTKISIEDIIKNPDGTVDVLVKGLEAIDYGKIKIIIKVTDYVSGNSFTKECNTKVYVPIKEINLGKNLKIIKGQSKNLVATLVPSDATDYTTEWSIVNGSHVISIGSTTNNNGTLAAMINGVEIGTAQVKLYLKNTITNQVVEGYCNIEVGIPIGSVDCLNNIAMNINRTKIIEVKINPVDVPVTKDNFTVTVADEGMVKAEIIEDIQGRIFNNGVVKIEVTGLNYGKTNLKIKVTDTFDENQDGMFETFDKDCTINVWRIDVN